MSNEHDFIDEFLQEQVEKADFPMKEEYWEKMSQLLDEEDKKKKRPFPFWRGLSLLLVVLTTSIVAYVVPHYSSKKLKSVAPTVESGTIHHSSAKVNGTPTPAVSSTSTGSIATEEPTQPKVETPAQPSTSNSFVTNSDPMVASSASTPDALSSTSTDETHSSTPIKTSKHAKSILPSREMVTKNKRTMATAPQKQTVSKTEPQTAAKPESISQPNVIDEAVKPSQPGVAINGKSYVETNRTVSITDKPRDQSIYNPRYQASLRNYIPEHIDSVIQTTYAPVPTMLTNPLSGSKDSSIAPLANVNPSVFNKRLLWFAQLGINLNMGLKGNIDHPKSLGISPYIGFGFQKPIRPTLNFAANLGFTYFNGLNMVKTESIYRYSFGVDSTNLRTYQKQLFQWYIPISLHYQWKEKHSLIAGMGITYSFQTSSKVEEDQYSYQPFLLNVTTTKQSTSSTVTSTNKGFQTIDFFLQAGYSYQIMHRMWLQLMVQQGFMDISKNSYYNNTVNNTLTRFSFGLQYQFNHARK